MDLRYSESEEAFRAGLRSWLAPKSCPTLPDKPSHLDWPARRAYDTTWQRMLFDAGYAGIDWPVEGGGRGASPVEQLIYLEELERAHAPYVGVNFVGLLHAGPTVIVEGTPEQRARFLPPSCAATRCGARASPSPAPGSDLASLRTRAERDGDEYVVTGQKIWTSHAEVADFCELLVRTGPEDSRHRGITWLILPMDRPGIDFRPLRTIAGSTEFGELFLDGVRVPVANRVGDENDGWRVTMTTLSFERGTAFVGEVLQSMELLRGLRAMAQRTGAWDDIAGAPPRRPSRCRARRAVGAGAAQRLPGGAHRSARDRRQRVQAGAVRAAPAHRRARHGPGRTGGLGLRRHARGARRWSGANGGQAEAVGNLEIVSTWVHSFSRTIAAGTSQIQRNIIAERILGLPKG